MIAPKIMAAITAGVSQAAAETPYPLRQEARHLALDAALDRLVHYRGPDTMYSAIAGVARVAALKAYRRQEATELVRKAVVCAATVSASRMEEPRQSDVDRAFDTAWAAVREDIGEPVPGAFTKALSDARRALEQPKKEVI